MIDQRHALGRHAFVIKLVVAEQILPSQLPHGGVVGDAQERRQNLLSDFFREGLSFAHVFLPVAFRAVAKNLVEEHRGGASREQRRANGWVDNRRLDQPFQLLAHGRFGSVHGLVIRRFFRIHPVKVVIAVDVHPVGRLPLDKQFQPVAHLSELQLRPFAGHLQHVLRLRAEGHDGIDDGRRFAKGFRVRAHFGFPRRAVHVDGNLRRDGNVRLLAGKIRGLALDRFYLHFFSRLDLNQRFFGGAVLFVGFEPGGAAQHFGVVIHGHGHDRVVALYLPFPDLVGVIQLVAAGAHRNL